MLAAARDVLATFFLDKRLGQLREEYIERALNRDELDENYWTRGEEESHRGVKEQFYTQGLRQIVKPNAPESDEEDYRRRSQRVGEHAIVMTHNLLRAIPFVGQTKDH